MTIQIMPKQIVYNRQVYDMSEIIKIQDLNKIYDTAQEHPEEGLGGIGPDGLPGVGLKALVVIIVVFHSV